MGVCTPNVFSLEEQRTTEEGILLKNHMCNRELISSHLLLAALRWEHNVSNISAGDYCCGSKQNLFGFHGRLKLP